MQDIDPNEEEFSSVPNTPRGSVDVTMESTLISPIQPSSSYSGPSTSNHFPDWDSLPEKHLVSDARTFFAYFKAFVGAGVLFLPHAFKSGGLTASTLTFVVTTILSTLCMLKMVEAKHRVVEDFKAGITHGVTKIHETVGFGMLGAVVLGPFGRALVDISIAISQLCFATAYLIFCSKNLHNIIYQFGNCDSQYFVSAVTIIWLLVPLLVPTMFIRQLAKFSFSIIVADSLIVLGLLFLYYRSALAMVDQGGLGAGIVQFDSVRYWTFLGTALYALEGTAFVLPIEHAMRNKENFPKVTVISGLSIGFMYMSFGLLGYMAFGESVEAVITLNLKHRNPHDWTAVAVQMAYCLALILAFPVAMFPVVRIVESNLFPVANPHASATAGGMTSSATIASASASALLNYQPHLEGGSISDFAGSTSASTLRDTAYIDSTTPGSVATNVPVVVLTNTPPVKVPNPARTWAKNGIRTLLTIVSAAVATGGGASFDNFVSLVGGLMCVPLTLIYPAYFHLKICGDRLTTRQRWEDYICILVGVIGTVACTVISIYEWIKGGSSDVDTCAKS